MSEDKSEAAKNNKHLRVERDCFPENESDFCKSLTYIGRILEDPDYYVWGCSTVYDDEGKVHV